MQNPFVPAADDPSAEVRRQHRMRLLAALKAICRRVERLQPPGTARAACREVAEGLQRWLAEESVARRQRSE